MKTYSFIKTCLLIFLATLFIISRRWKQPKYLSKDEWINKTVVYAYNGILFSHKNKQSTAVYLWHGWTWKHANWIKPDTKGHILYVRELYVEENQEREASCNLNEKLFSGRRKWTTLINAANKSNKIKTKNWPLS